MTPSTRPQPFWDYVDLGLFITLCFPSLLISILLVRGVAHFLPFGKPFLELLVAQLVWYALIFGALYALLFMRYQQPVWRSLGWNPLRPAVALLSFLAGPVLALSIGWLGYVLRTPEIKLPFQQMLDDRVTLIVAGIFIVILGPLCEEVAFRGFLMPLLMRSFGVAGGIVLTGAIFGCIHGYEYEWSWRHMLLISLAGTIFGWARHKSGSLVSSTLMHSTFNLTQFAAFLVQSRTL